MDQSPTRRRSLVFPILLVGVGLYLLAHNFGWIETSPWKALATLWPLFLVAIGLDMLLGRARPWAALIVAGLFTLVCLALFHSDTVVHRAFRDQPMEEKTFEVQLNNAPAGVVDLDLDLGEVTVGALPQGSPLLAQGEGRTGPDGRLDVKDAAGDAGTKVTIRFDQRHRGPRICLPGWDQGREMDLRLSPAVPLEFKVHLDAGTCDLDLSALQVRKLDADLDIGTGTIRLSPGIAQGVADFKVDVGTLELRVPEGCAARLKVDGDLTTVDVDENRFPPSGEGYTATDRVTDASKRRWSPAWCRSAYRSSDWETAACKWDISIRGDLATLTVR